MVFPSPVGVATVISARYRFPGRVAYRSLIAGIVGVCRWWHDRVVIREQIMVMMKLRERESIQEAVRRFRKLVERSG